MTTRWILRLGVLGLAAAAPALADSIADDSPGPATKFTGFLCRIDLGENGLPIPPQVQPRTFVVTGDTEKLCTNSSKGGNIKMTCRATIPGWTAAPVDLKDVHCEIRGAQCNLAGSFTADLSMLKIDAAGNATLTCQSKANQR
jgi:hypothetical protein